jgi:putative ABC transport system permease protein
VGRELFERIRVGREAAGNFERFASVTGDMDILADARRALRGLFREPSFTAAAVLILALGIGANTVVFSIVEGVLLRPLAYREPERLFSIHEIIPELARTLPVLPVNGRHYMEWKRRCSSFEDLAIAEGAELNLTGDGQPERLSGVRATASLFSLLGVEARLGRTFAPGEDRPGNDAVAVISDSLWRRRFGADPSIAGRSVELSHCLREPGQRDARPSHGPVA